MSPSRASTTTPSIGASCSFSSAGWFENRKVAFFVPRSYRYHFTGPSLTVAATIQVRSARSRLVTLKSPGVSLRMAAKSSASDGSSSFHSLRR